jgi:enolase
MNRYEIAKVKAREILDRQGRPIVEVKVLTKEGILGRAGAPCGISTGKCEAFVLRDNGKKRYAGLGVLKAVRNVNDIIAPKLIGKDVTLQREIDEMMISLDGTENKSKLGANAILSVSLAVAKAAAATLALHFTDI